MCECTVCLFVRVFVFGKGVIVDMSNICTICVRTISCMWLKIVFSVVLFRDLIKMIGCTFIVS